MSPHAPQGVAFLNNHEPGDCDDSTQQQFESFCRFIPYFFAYEFVIEAFSFFYARYSPSALPLPLSLPLFNPPARPPARPHFSLLATGRLLLAPCMSRSLVSGFASGPAERARAAGAGAG